MLRTVIGDYESGQLELRSPPEGTTVAVHWPADRELDEWIDFSLRLDHRDEAEIAASGGTFSVGGPDGNMRTLPSLDGSFKLRCSGTSSVGPVQADLSFRDSERAVAKLLEHFSNVSASHP